tara:strand:+ start:15058 stop:16014 length:957 start_codon:yes stop_codon:yes gene_type:complete
MESKNAKIYVASVKNVSKQLEYYGDADISNINLLKLIYKYSCYCVTYEQLQRLNTMVSQLQNKDSMICSEIQAARGADYPNVLSIVEVGTNTNSAPTLSDSSFTLDDPDYTYTFTYDDLFSSYNDVDGNALGNFIINSLPAQGSLQYNGSDVVVDTLYLDPTLLTYTRFGIDSYSEGFTYSAFDNDAQLPLQSNIVTCTGTINEITSNNEAPTVGDRAQYAGNRVTTVFTLADFTSETIAPYFDPENNDLDAIRIDEVSTANTGTYYYFGNPVVVGQVITADELSNGAFYHEAPDANGITTDSFNASVRDNVNMTWVS